MQSTTLVDTAGRRRSPATLPGYHQGRPPRNKGQRYPADPPTVVEIIAVMRAAGEDHDAIRLRGLIVVLWRAGLRVSEALAVVESDLDSGSGAVLVRRGKGGSAARSGWIAGPGSVKTWPRDQRQTLTGGPAAGPVGPTGRMSRAVGSRRLGGVLLFVVESVARRLDQP